MFSLNARRAALALALSAVTVAPIVLTGAPEVGAAAAPSLVGRTPMATSGARIVDRNGAEVILQGVNWFGFETSNHAPHGLWARDYRDMLTQIRSLGFNIIRLPFSIQALQSSTVSGVDFSGGKNAALAGKTPLQVMDVIIQEAAAQGLLVLLDNHSLGDDGFGYDLWYGTGGYTEDSWVANWQMLAQRYRSQGNVIGADLKNEPHGRATWGDGTATDWRRAAGRAGSAVLVVAPHWLIVVEGTEGPVPGQQLPGHWWGGNLEAAGRYPVQLTVANRLVYSPHEYGPGVYNQPWFSDPNYQAVLYDRWAKGFQYLADQGTAPILVGEFGGRQTGVDTVEGVWQRQFMDHLAKKGYSWTYWAWNPNSGDTGGVLLEDWLTVNQPKMDLLTLLINRQAVPFPPPGGSTTSTTTSNPTTSTTRPTSTTTSTSTTTTTTRPPGGPGLTAAFAFESRWQTGYCGRFVVTNSTGSQVTGLRLSFDLAGTSQIASSWNGTFVRSATTVSVSLPDWARTLAAGARYSETGMCVQGQDRPSSIRALAS